MKGRLEARISKRFEDACIELQLSQPIDQYFVTVLFGPSGCGKTTLLRCIAGLERPDSGKISFGNQVWFDDESKVNLSIQERNTGLMFQDYALFPFMTLTQNIGYALRTSTVEERASRVNELIKMFGLQGRENYLPKRLSGGQKQRVALARTIAKTPKLLMLDEPLSALDSALREELRGELRQMLKRLELPTLIVTHDRTEAIALADQIVVLDQGQVRQVGTPADVFSKPVDLATAKLLGVENVLAAKVTKRHDGLADIRIGKQNLLSVAPDQLHENVHACIRAEDVILMTGDPGSTSARNHLWGEVTELTPEGPLVRVRIDCGFELMALITKLASEDLQLRKGTQVKALVKVTAIHLLDRS